MIEPFEATYQEELYQIRPPVTVLLGKPWKDIPLNEQTLLGKILASARQHLNGVRIIHCLKATPADFTSGSKVISFGVPFVPDIPAYKMTESNGSSIILADPLPELDDVKKKSLWIEIKKAFIL